MRQITINAKYRIISGACANMEGKAVGYDSVDEELWLQLDPFTTVLLSPENVEMVEE